MNEKTKSLLKEWVLPIAIIGILWVTGLHRPVIAFMQRMILTTGIIKPDTDLENTDLGTADYTWQLYDEEGQPVSFSAFRDKVVFINFFATWCPPCIAELPGIQNLYEDSASDDVVFVIISRDDDPQKTIDFMKRKEFDLPVFYANSVPDEFISNVLPSTFIIDRNGKIVSRHHGMADYDNQKVRDFISGLAGQ